MQASAVGERAGRLDTDRTSPCDCTILPYSLTQPHHAQDAIQAVRMLCTRAVWELCAMVTPQPSGVGIYVRKSSDKQGELSLPAQERICRQVIVEPTGLTVYRIYQDILSGKRPDRADYQQLLADARSGRLCMVVFRQSQSVWPRCCRRADGGSGAA